MFAPGTDALSAAAIVTPGHVPFAEQSAGK